MQTTKKREGLRLILYIFMVALLVYVTVYMPTPYIIYQPGSADEVKPMLSVQKGERDEKGTFMMTTVSASYANLVMLVVSAFNPNAEIDQKQSRLGNKSEDEYAAEQVYMMNDSQSSAVEAAYHEANVSYSIVPQYLFIFSTPEGDEARKNFKPGDHLSEVDGHPIRGNESLSSLLKSKKVGDQVTVKLIRDGKELEEKVNLIEIKDKNTNQMRPGLGVTIATMQKVEPKDPGLQVNFANTRIGGPSAGLMFTMEIYNQLTEGDLTKGYQVAGTGTIDKDGNVGPIGGVQHKIVAADRKHAEIFFVPKENYADAKAKADKIKTNMKLVPVNTLEDAIHYMDSLQAKS
ncbi:SepM family pheromone-processing serine protease [Paenibacillus sp.]|uniref:SepM family pheromone-processing serine protease n=1 Tax=Paenibacillus sp. TaxID=58172 RepID=UPI00281F5391|nr:SepM family pheromone-processing serine protease [Paenibacillus sp.]MDR0269156.1 PDZ domain-containing protein [Paenibacillus sp.]